MNDTITIQRAAAGDIHDVSIMVGELLEEIMQTIGEQVFAFSFSDTASRLEEFIAREKYFVFIARCRQGNPAGFIALYESYALYAEGAFGTIPELYVRPEYRNAGLGRRLVSDAKAFGASRGWKRLEVTTPPLPEFGLTLAFYEREGFEVTGGRKMKVLLP